MCYKTQSINEKNIRKLTSIKFFLMANITPNFILIKNSNLSEAAQTPYNKPNRFGQITKENQSIRKNCKSTVI